MTHLGDISGLPRSEMKKTEPSRKAALPWRAAPERGDRVTVSAETSMMSGLFSEWMSSFSEEDLVRPEALERARALLGNGGLVDEDLLKRAADGLMREALGLFSDDEAADLGTGA